MQSQERGHEYDNRQFVYPFSAGFKSYFQHYIDQGMLM